jgi:uncharacterized protein YciI
MYIIDLKYIVPLEEVDSHMAAHVKYLDKYYQQNIFILSGRKVPRTGGVIIALADSVEDLEEIITEDPFHEHELAKFTITEFLTSKYHPDLKNLLDS